MADGLERQESRKKVESKEKILYSFVDFTHELLTKTDPKEALSKGLAMLGKATQVDRVYYWEKHYDDEEKRWLISQKLEWCGPGVEAEINNPDLQNVPLEEASDFVGVLAEKKFFSAHIKDMIDGPNSTKKVLEAQGIKSILAIPVFQKDQFRGFIGFDSCQKERDWSQAEVSLLKAFVLLYVEALERSLLEEKMVQARENLNNFFNMINDMLIVLDHGGHILQVNDSVLNRLNYSREGVLGRHVLIFHPKDQAVLVARNIEALISKEIEVCDIPAITRDGQVFPVETRVSEGLWDGEPVIFAVSKDITDLRMSEEKFSKAFNNSGVSMFITSLEEGELLTVNDTFLELMGYSREEMIGKHILDFHIYENEDQRHLITESIKKDGKVVNFEIKLKGKDQVFRTGLMNIVALNINNKPCLLSNIVDIADRVAYEEELLKMSNRDSLTGVYSRRCIYEKVEGIIQKYRQDKRTFSLVIIDIDHFKSINDQYGHQIGDKVLIEFTKRIEESLRLHDLLGRYGGEEFILVLNHSDRESSHVVLERILDNCRRRPFVFGDISIGLTFSAGISAADELDLDQVSTDRLVEIADQRMYIGKQSGRNRIIYKDLAVLA